MAFDPETARILLVGPRVVHLRPFFEKRRYQVVAVQRGVEGMTALDEARRDIVILELNLGDLTATEFLMAARQAHADSAFLLLDDASKAGQIVKALQAGLDGYLPTPPDEDRLFFEIERHLKMQGGGSSSHAPPSTQLTMRPPELDTIQSQLIDRESQLVEITMQNELLQQEIAGLRPEARAFRDVKQALIGVLDGELDGESAVRIKERLAMATVLETETDTLRDELAEAKKVRRDLQDQVEQLKKANASSPKVDPAAAEAAKEKIEELEAESMVLAGKVNELEEELDLARAESVALQQKSKAEIDDLQKEIKRLNVDRASDRGDVERTTAEHMQTMQKLAREHQTEVQKQASDHQREIEKLKKELDVRVTKLQSEVEVEKKSADERLKIAIEKRERELLGGADKAKTELEAQLRAALAEKEQAIEKALDIELIHDELTAKIEFLEAEVKREKERATKAETDFKKEKVRLVEEKEAAASGSHEAFDKMQRFVDENTTLRRKNEELESQRASLEARAKKGDEALAQVSQQIVDQERINKELEAARSQFENLKGALENENTRLRERVRALENEAQSLQQDVQQARNAAGDAGQVAARLADAVVKRDELAREVAHLQERLRDAESQIEKSVSDVDAARGENATHQVMMDDLRERARDFERKLNAEVQARAADRQAMDAQLREMNENARATQADLEAKLKSAVGGAAGGLGEAAAAAISERDAYRQRLQETEAWVQQAQVHLEALAKEREALGQQLAQARGDAQSKSAEAQELYAQLAQVKSAVESLTARAGGLQQQLDDANVRSAMLKEQLENAHELAATQPNMPIPSLDGSGANAQLAQQAQQAQQAQEEARALRQQLSQVQQHAQQALAQAQQQAQQAQQALQQAQQQQAQGGGPDLAALRAAQDEVRALRQQLAQAGRGGAAGGLPEELEPLRWTLNAAIDQLTTLENREPALGTHLRNLRLLAQSLQRLSGR